MSLAFGITGQITHTVITLVLDEILERRKTFKQNESITQQKLKITKLVPMIQCTIDSTTPHITQLTGQTFRKWPTFKSK